MVGKQIFLGEVRKWRAKLARVIKHSPKSLYNLDLRAQKEPALARHALISYITYPFLIPQNSPELLRHQQTLCAIEMVRVLNSLGYLVDVIDFRNIHFIPKTDYDLFIGHGGVNFEYISRQLIEKAVKIYFSTGIYWKEWNIREARRLNEFTIRRGYLLPPDRGIKESEEFANQSADGIICLGNQAAVETYQNFQNVICIHNFVFPGTKALLEDKDFESGRRHFLFFSGPGNIHKGLDVLLEAFAGSEFHLHICQHIDERFAVVYHQELTGSLNIHVYGSINLRSPEFERLTSLCNFTITATCAEGQPGAVLECMACGLIPILPEGANIDLDNFGIPLQDCRIGTIRSAIAQAASLSAGECRQRSLFTAEAVQQSYSQEGFRRSFSSAAQEIIAKVRPNPNHSFPGEEIERNIG